MKVANLKDVAKALLKLDRRLVQADTDLKRKNARRAILSVLRMARRLMQEKKSIRPAPCCPLCKAPMRNFVSLVMHFARRHGSRDRSGYLKCPCGLHGKGETWKEKCTFLARHLAAQRNLKLHISMARIGGQP